MTSFNLLTQENNTRMRDLLSKLPNLTVAGFPKDLETFTLFPNLPLELRRNIWGYAGDHPRTLQLISTRYMKKPGGSIEGHNKIPGILQACSESRKEGLKHYTACTKRCICLEWIHDTNGHVESRIPCTASKIYINFDVDRFYLQKMVDWDRVYRRDSLTAYQLERRDLAKFQLLDIPWVYARVIFLDESVMIHETKRLREVNFFATPYFYEKVRLENSEFVKDEDICPNTITSEICMVKHRNRVKRETDEKKFTDRWWPDHTVLESLKDTNFDCKWTAIPEEMGLFPIPAGAATTYDRGSGCVENKERFGMRLLRKNLA
jgi:hypothetical protein